MNPTPSALRLASLLRKLQLGSLARLSATPESVAPASRPDTHALLDHLEVATSYLLLDLEATRRERDLLLEMLETRDE